MVKLEDIARRASVSIATVSYILNDKASNVPVSEKTREKVLRIAKELGYTPNPFARSLRTKKSNIIGVIVWDLTDPYFSTILSGVEHVLEQSGYYLVLNDANKQTEKAAGCMEKLNTISTEGVLVLGLGHAHDSEIFANLHEQMNIVSIATKSWNSNISSVYVDNFKGGYMAMDYLFSQERNRYFYVSAAELTTDEEQRLQGVQKAVQEKNYGDRFTLIEARLGEEGGYRATKRLLQKCEPPISIFAMDDITAIGCVRAIKDRGLQIPGEVAIMGFDDLSITRYIEPRLTTIRQPRFELGEKGAQLLLGLLEQKPDVQKTDKRVKNVVLEPSIVVREST